MRNFLEVESPMDSITTKNKIGKSFVFALLAIMLIASVSLAQNPGKRLRERFGEGNDLKQQRLDLKQQRLRQKMGKELNPGFGGGMQGRVWARALKLTDDQISRMRQVMRVSAENYLLIQRQAQEKRFQLERSTFSENINEETLKQMATELGKLEGQMVFLRTKVQLQIRNILTPEQLKIYNELRFGFEPENDLPEKGNTPPIEQKNNNQ